MNPATDPTAAPADRREHAPWPRWRKLTAYALLLILALLSIWFIDRRVDALANLPRATQR